MALEKTRRFSYILVLFPPLIAAFLQKLVYNIDSEQFKSIYSGALLITVSSYILYMNAFLRHTVYDTFNYYKFNQLVYILYASIFSIILFPFKGNKNIEEEEPKKDEPKNEDNKKDKKEEKPKKTYFLSNTAMYISFFFIAGTQYIQRFFGDVEPDQIMFHLTVSVVGDEAGEYFICFIWYVLVIPLILTFVIRYLLNKMPDYYTLDSLCQYKIHIFKEVPFYFLMIYSIYVFITETSVHKFFDFKDDTFIEDHYADPVTTQLVWPQKKRNFIFLCLESMESTFTSKEYGGFFDENMIPNLTKIALDPSNAHFSHTNKLGGGARTALAYWSIAGAFAMWSGLPFKWGESENRRGFIPGAYTALDMFVDQGYDQYLVFGHKNGFGVGPFYTRHGAVTMFDADGIRKELPKYKKMNTHWGVHDYVVYEMARKILLEKVNLSKPFNLVINTIDTHFQDGFVCDRCKLEHDYQYYDVFHCADRQVEEFITFLKTLPFYNDTTVFIVGDHHSMSRKLDGMIRSYDRRIYNAFVNPAIKAAKNATKNRMFLSYDWFPTILASIGVKIKGDRLALGTNLFSGKQTLVEELGSYSSVNDRMSRGSMFYNHEILHYDPEGIFFDGHAEWMTNSSAFKTRKII